MNLSKKRGSGDAKMELQIAPLIDVVFLLLIYFMVTASLIKKEGDISFVLPASVPPTKMIDIPVEALIFILQDGTVEMDGLRFSSSDLALDELSIQVAGLREIASSQQSPFSVTITPHERARQSRIIDVMDACAAAGTKNLSFGKSML
ncbi:MAG: biopolymer transporter ExbD [Kiritimatiellales bacterium]|nr:biopolymer transporter ExbD [Kiritimatiellales bacterium]